MAAQEFTYTRGDLEQLTGMTKAGISQHIGRGNLDMESLVSVAAFIVRYGTPDVRLAIMMRAMGVDRQEAERSRPQSTKNYGRDKKGRVIPRAVDDEDDEQKKPVRLRVSKPDQ